MREGENSFRQGSKYFSEANFLIWFIIRKNSFLRNKKLSFRLSVQLV